MNINWTDSARLLAATAIVTVVGGHALAQTCDGPLNTLPPETDSFENPLTLFDWTDIPVEVPAFVPQGDEELVLATISFSLELDGTLEYTNLTGSTCPVVPWTLDSDLAASAPFPLPGFPLDETFPSAGQFTNVPSGDTASTTTDFASFTAGPFEFKDDEAQVFVGNPGDMLTFLTTVSADFSAMGCSPQEQASDLTASVQVTVEYTTCEDEPPPPPPPTGCVCEEPSPHYRKPGSLLLFPEFDNREGDLTLFTITNTDCTGDDVDVELIFIDHEDCSEFNTTITLTPCDTFTAITNAVNPNMEQGYFYAFAKNDAGETITHNGLIGSSMTISGIEAFDYQINPVSFMGMTGEGNLTDLDDDGIRDLDGLEYEPAPDTITIPRFLGQGLDPMGRGDVDSRLILIGLSGGQDFDTTICFDVYNDNEEGFSGEYTFYCWEKPTLLEVRGSFANSFLKTTNHDPNEILGYTQRESGWICMDGCFATSTQETIADPAFYAVLVEQISNYSASDLPFECGRQLNGALLPRGLFGDGDPIPANNDNM